MNLLALESSTDTLSVALLANGHLSERIAAPGENHSARILGMINQLLQEAGLTISALDGIAFGDGPGAFTGLRLSCSVAQGLALGAGLPVLGVCSLEALAFEHRALGKCFVCMDARMNEVYYATYECSSDGALVTHLPPAVASPDALLLPEGCAWQGLGSGFASYGEALSVRLGDQVRVHDANARPLAGAVAQLALAGFQQGLAGDAANLAPRYVRDRVAFTTAERLARGGRA